MGQRCKACGEEKHKEASGKIAKSGNYLYCDEKGRLWKGNVCPDCQAALRKIARSRSNKSVVEPKDETE